MEIKNELRAIFIRAGWTMSAIVEALNVKYDRKDTLQNLSNKLARNSLRYNEAMEIADVMGYEIKWVKIEK
jgi:predicted RNA-binding protein Jag